MSVKVQRMCLVLVLLLFLSACNWDVWHLDIRNATEIADIYYESKALFGNAAETLIQYTDKHLFITTSNEVPNYRTYESYKIGDVNLFVVGGQSLSDTDCKNIYNVVAPLFEVREFEYIASWYTWVSFSLESRAGQYADLLYEPNGGEITMAFGVVDELWINNCWYAVTSSD